MRTLPGLRPIVCLLITALFASVASADDPELQLKRNLCRGHGYHAGRAVTARDYDWDVLHATLRLTPDFDNHLLESDVTFHIRSEIAGLAEIRLDLADAMAVQSVAVDGAAAGWTHVDRAVAIPLDPPAAAGTEFDVAVVALGSPDFTGMGSFTWTDHAGTPLVATLSEPEGARDWWPCKDVPDDKFTADIFYVVPAEYSAPGPGLLQSVTDNGDGTRTWHWRESYPISTYLIALTVTNYDHYTDWYYGEGEDPLPIENYVYPENYANSVEDLSITPEAIQVMVDHFGDYPFKAEKYGHMTFHWGGAMEHQTCTSFGNWLLSGGHYYDRIVVHELAHQWFGDAVTLQDWENVWLNEGFARYSEALWFEHREGPQGLRDYMNGIRVDPHFDGAVYNNPSLFGTTVYNKGGWVVDMLRFLVDDDDAFFAALREYLARHMYGNAHTTDLRADLEDVLGLDLEQFFQQWVYGENRPVYEWSWRAAGGPGDRRAEVMAHQVQTNAGLFETPLILRVTTAAGTTDVRVDNELWLQYFEIPLGDEEPLDVAFDPDFRILRNLTEVTWPTTAVDGGQPEVATALTGNWPNPFNPSTRVAFTLAEAGHARIDIFDAGGRRVRRLTDSPRAAGPHTLTWDGLDDRGRELPGGLYLARLRAGGEVATLRMTLLK